MKKRTLFTKKKIITTTLFLIVAGFTFINTTFVYPKKYVRPEIDGFATLSPNYDQLQKVIDTYLKDPYVQAALLTIAHYEVGQKNVKAPYYLGFRTCFGGSLCVTPNYTTDYSKKHVVFIRGEGDHAESSRGMWMFINKTWHDACSDLGINPKRFTPINQTRAAVLLMIEQNAPFYFGQGRIKEGFQRLDKIWAVIPESPYGYAKATWNDFLRTYHKYLRRCKTQQCLPTFPKKRKIRRRGR